jgi:hypothetical protein
VRFAGFHRRFDEADARGHDLSALAKEELLAVAPLHWPIAAFGLDLKKAFSRRNRFELMGRMMGGAKMGRIRRIDCWPHWAAILKPNTNFRKIFV